METREGATWGCFYAVLSDWSTFEPSEYLIKDVCNPTHPEHNKLLIELNRVHKLPNFNSNLNHLINIKKTLI